ncbi:hypothetical protein LOTGIDRAFT_160490 [Lottia gigantea]|uniref:Uncharacterized protein n=1 Tax=Lottia gigantea TaxID=225164 RepID=V3ZV59_LOTGI|nr:hypothetical protein LOTGIDRAFT_160490 [Lottia gigantea]ESO95358.1 hypothetical protein LOTGIDRAFT_160490 [Lottia gigantea]
MAFNKALHVKRFKPFLNVSLVHSKTGYAILRGSSFYDRTLNVCVKRYNKNACATTRNIEHQKQQVIKRRNTIMNRSEKLVNAYNLPPLKPSSADSAKHNSYKLQRGSQEIGSGDRLHRAHLLQERHKNPNQDLSSNMKLVNSVEFNSLTDIRGTMSSPAPREHVEETLSQSTGAYSKPNKESSGSFPAIMVQKCDANTPKTSRKNRSISDDMRTLSANSLYVPSPLILRRREGNSVTESDDNLSRSEGSLHMNNLSETLGKENPSMPFGAPVSGEKKRPGIISAEEVAIEEFRKHREMYSPSTPRKPVRLIALSQASRSQSTGDVNPKRK